MRTGARTGATCFRRSRKSAKKQWSRWESNPRPLDCQSLSEVGAEDDRNRWCRRPSAATTYRPDARWLSSSRWERVPERVPA